MTRRKYIISRATLLLGSLGLALMAGESYARQGGESGSPVPFSVVSVHFEQNAADDDVEVVFEAGGGREGLAKLTVVSPDGRTVVDFTAPNVSALAMRQFRFESPEPKEINSLKSAYPEGVYIFDGTTASGGKLHGKDTLNHQLPVRASFLQPEAEAAGVATRNLKITWAPARNLSAYIIYIEQTENRAINITAKLPGAATTFDVPDGFLLPGTEYKLRIGTVAEQGNTSFVETTFFTTRRE